MTTTFQRVTSAFLATALLVTSGCSRNPFASATPEEKAEMKEQIELVVKNAAHDSEVNIGRIERRPFIRPSILEFSKEGQVAERMAQAAEAKAQEAREQKAEWYVSSQNGQGESRVVVANGRAIGKIHEVLKIQDGDVIPEGSKLLPAAEALAAAQDHNNALFYQASALIDHDRSPAVEVKEQKGSDLRNVALKELRSTIFCAEIDHPERLNNSKADHFVDTTNRIGEEKILQVNGKNIGKIAHVHEYYEGQVLPEGMKLVSERQASILANEMNASLKEKAAAEIRKDTKPVYDVSIKNGNKTNLHIREANRNMESVHNENVDIANGEIKHYRGYVPPDFQISREEMAAIEKSHQDNMQKREFYLVKQDRDGEGRNYIVGKEWKGEAVFLHQVKDKERVPENINLLTGHEALIAADELNAATFTKAINVIKELPRAGYRSEIVEYKSDFSHRPTVGVCLTQN